VSFTGRPASNLLKVAIAVVFVTVREYHEVYIGSSRSQIVVFLIGNTKLLPDHAIESDYRVRSVIEIT
jgi:hypothetical protein